MFGRSKKNTIKREQIRGSKIRNKSKIDYKLLLVVAFMLCFGLVMIFSASAILAYTQYGDTFFYFKRQLVWIFIGTLLGIIAYKIPISTLQKHSNLFLIIGLILMIYLLPEALSPLASNGINKVIEVPLVNTRNGATRWIDFFGIFDLQPAELIKLALIIFTASWFSLKEETKSKIEKYIKKFQDNTIIYFIANLIYVFFPFIILGLIAVLILAERDLDTIVVIALTFFAIYFAAGTQRRHTLTAIFFLCVSVIVGIIAMLTESYRASRFNAYLQILLNGEPSEISKRGDSFQVWNGLIAIGSGGLMGVGYNNSRQKLFFLQEAAYTDSIFAVIAEEFGLVGSIVVILSFLYFTSRGLAIAKSASTKFSSLLAVGLTSWITIQAFLNIAANLSVIPFGGMPLPFFTYGGSNTITVLIAVGILLNISREKKTASDTRKISYIRRPSYDELD